MIENILRLCSDHGRFDLYHFRLNNNTGWWFNLTINPRLNSLLILQNGNVYNLCKLLES